MPQPGSTPAGAPCWIDLSSSDQEKSARFYGELFGWTAERGGGEEYGGYLNFFKDGRQVAGCVASKGGWGHGDAWTVYLATDDVQRTAAAAEAHGGQVLVPPTEIGELGSMVYVRDTGHAGIGAWQAGAHTGFHTGGEPGTPGWFELHTRDYDSCVEFYRQVFGWDAHEAGDTPTFRYTTLGQGDAAVAGIMDAAGFLPTEAPANWQVYFRVDDTDAALARVEELGGAIVQPADDSPYGRLAQAADSTGAGFRLIAT